ncbi:MAG: DUF3616 domain-containing protein, partial [Bradyrhizobium sp.]
TASNLWTIMTSLPELKDRVGKCLGAEHGVNIEGLAIKGDRLFFGFREPAQDGFVPVLGVDADALFKGGDAKPRVTSIAVGAGRGIRDLAAVKDGVLILAGPDDSEANKDVHVTISLWDGESSDTGPVTPRSLAELDLRDVKLRECDKELKPEALAVIEDASDHYRVAVLSDGMCDGGPMTFVIPR